MAEDPVDRARQFAPFDMGHRHVAQRTGCCARQGFHPVAVNDKQVRAIVIENVRETVDGARKDSVHGVAVVLIRELDHTDIGFEPANLDDGRAVLLSRCMPVATTVTRIPGSSAAPRIRALSLPKSARVPVRKQTCLTSGVLDSTLDIAPPQLMVLGKVGRRVATQHTVELGGQNLAGSRALDPDVRAVELLT